MSKSEDAPHYPDGSPIIKENTCNKCGAPRGAGCDHHPNGPPDPDAYYNLAGQRVNLFGTPIKERPNER
jgi:hypothetical protein